MDHAARAVDASAAAEPARRPAPSAWAVLVASVLVALVTAWGIVELRRYAEGNLHEAVLFVRLDGLAHRLRGLEAQAKRPPGEQLNPAERERAAEHAADLRAARAALDRALTELERLDAEEAEGVRAAAERYLADVAELGRLVAAEADAEAEAWGEARVGPSFAAFDRLLKEGDREHHELVDRTSWLADAGTVVAVGLATLMVGLLFRRFEGARRMAVALTAEQRALAASEERFRSLVEHASDMILVVDTDGQVQYISRSVKRLLGHDPEDLLGSDGFGLVHPGDVARLRGFFAGVLAAPGTAPPVELRLRHADGSWRHVESLCNNLLGDAIVGGVVINSRDITDRKEAQERLRASERLLAVSQQLAHIGSWEWDIPSNSVSWSDELYRIYGLAPREFAASYQGFLARVHPDDREQVDAAIRQALATCEPFSFDHRIVRPDGSVRVLQAWGEVVLDGSGGPVGMAGTGQDITERKHAEEVRERQGRYAAMRADVTEALAAGGGLPEMLQRCAEALVRRLDAAFARVWVLDEAAGVLELRASAGLYTHLDGAHARIPVGHLKIGRIAAERRPHLTNDVPNDPRIGDREWAVREGMVAFAGHPLLVEGRPVGVMALFAHRVLPDDALEALASVADALAQGVERRRAEEELREAETKYRTLVEQIPAVTYVSEWSGANPEGGWRYLYVSPQILALLGYAPEEWAADPGIWERSLHPDDRGRVLAEDARVEAVGGPYSVEHRFVARDGRVVWVRDQARMIGGEVGAARVWQGVMLDITAQKEAEAALRESEAQFRLLFASNPHPMWVYDRETLAFLEVNEAAVACYGYARDEFLAMRIADVRPEEDMPRLLENLARVRPALERAGEWRHRLKDGRVIDVEITSYTLAFRGRPAVLVVAQDITERKALEAQLVHQAFHDPLTGLPNRALLLDRLGHALERAARRPGSVGVLFVDLDDFKVVNDSLGHKAGDRLLVAVAERLRGCLRPEDTIARLGGDEFTVLLEDAAGRHAAVAAAERIAVCLRPPFAVEGHELFVTPSIGITLGGGDRRRPGDLLREADVALYHAKHRGKAGHALFDPSMDERAWARLRLEGELRRALEAGELRVLYQPLVDLATGRVAEVEALARWVHPERGLLPPGEFVPLAEETGLVVPLGRWVLEEACHQVRAWQLARPDEPPLGLSVNLSVRQFRHPGLVAEVAEVLRETGLAPRLLTLEITESVAMDDEEGTAATLRALKGLGVRLAVDDFGTGYSALGYLRRCPVDALKVDRSYIAGLGKNPEDEAIVRAVVAFARTMGLEVTAEGIETAEQLAELRGMGCERGQGFYFAGPLAAEAAGAFLERRLSPALADTNRSLPARTGAE